MASTGTKASKLSEREGEIIAALQLRGDTPLSTIAKTIGYRDHSVRYFVHSLEERSVIVRRCFINLNLLGYTHLQIYFYLSTAQKESRHRFLNTLVNAEQVSWIGELGGDYQYGLSVCARNIAEVWRFLDTLSCQFGPIFFEKVIGVRISLHYFGNKYLSRRKRKYEELSYAATPGRVEIDETDHRILTAVTLAPRDSLRDLGRRCGLPHATLDHRLRRLRNLGVVGGYYYEVQWQRIGMQSFMLLISVKGINSAFRQGFYEYCRAHPAVTTLIHSIGSWDFEAEAHVAEAGELTAIIEELHDRFAAAINWIKVLPLIRHVKVKEYPFKAWNG